MANIQALRRRIRSIQGTTKICRAMEMVATAKMKRTQLRALAGRPYTEKIREVIADLAIEPRVKGKVATLFQKREVKKIVRCPHGHGSRTVWGTEHEPESACG